MRILLDTRDLIELVEHSRPMTALEFGEYLAVRDHEIVLTFSNVRELAGPLAANVEFMQVRPLLQLLEGIPHTYLREGTISAAEIEANVEVFVNGNVREPFSPYVTRWDRTLMPLPGQKGSAADDLVNLRLDDIIFMIYRARPDIFSPPYRYLPTLQVILGQDRDLLRTGQAPARRHFINAILKHANSYRVQLPDGREEEFAEWIYTDPDRCPGFRLNHEAYRALMMNYTDIPETGDFSDLAHISAIPYVEAATLDRRMRHYCGVASRKITKLGSATNYAARVYNDISDFVGRNP